MVADTGQSTGPTIHTAALVGIHRSLEALWLAAVFLVPLAFLSRSDILSSPVIVFIEVPKVAILRTLAGLMVALWLAKWVIQSNQPAGARQQEKRLWENLTRLIRPVGALGWVRLAVVLYFVSVLISTVLSASLPVSLWGEVPGQDGYEAYTTAAYAVLFAVIATHLKDQGQLWRLLVAVAAAGVLVGGYAVSQHYGGDFFRLLGPIQPERATSTLDNAIYVGSVLLITLTVSVAAAATALSGPRKARGFWWMWMLWTAVLAVQMLGIIFTSSRGPWVGTIFALGTFVGLAVIFAGWRAGIRGASVLAAAAAITAAVLFLPGLDADNGFGPGLESAAGEPSRAA